MTTTNSDAPTAPVLTTTPSRLKVVLEHTTGPHKGLFQIMGKAEDFDGQQAPVCTDPFDVQPHPRKAVAGLVRVTRRYLLYREIDTPLTSRLDPRQR